MVRARGLASSGASGERSDRRSGRTFNGHDCCAILFLSWIILGTACKFEFADIKSPASGPGVGSTSGTAVPPVLRSRSRTVMTLDRTGTSLRQIRASSAKPDLFFPPPSKLGAYRAGGKMLRGDAGSGSLKSPPILTKP